MVLANCFAAAFCTSKEVLLYRMLGFEPDHWMVIAVLIFYKSGLNFPRWV